MPKKRSFQLTAVLLRPDDSLSAKDVLCRALYRNQTFQPPSHPNLEVLKNKPRKTWRLGPQTWRLQKYASNKNSNDILFVSEYSSPNKCSLLYCFAACLQLGSFSSRDRVSRCARYPLVVGRIAVAVSRSH